jgi:hypothetical protein
MLNYKSMLASSISSMKFFREVKSVSFQQLKKKQHQNI